MITPLKGKPIPKTPRYFGISPYRISRFLCDCSQNHLFCAIKVPYTPAIRGPALWSVACLFIDTSYRKKGVSKALRKAASGYTTPQGAELIEGYPVEPKSDKDIAPACSYPFYDEDKIDIAALKVNATDPKN